LYGTRIKKKQRKASPSSHREIKSGYATGKVKAPSGGEKKRGGARIKYDEIFRGVKDSGEETRGGIVATR